MKDLGVVVYLDDLLIAGKTEQEHLQQLQNVLQRLQESGLRVKKSKKARWTFGTNFEQPGNSPIPWQNKNNQEGTDAFMCERG